MANASKLRFERSVLTLATVAEMIGSGTVGAIAAILLTQPTVMSQVGALVWVTLLVAAVGVALPLVGLRREARAALDKIEGRARLATVGDVVDMTAECSAEHAEILVELAVLRAELRRANRPWWKRVRDAR